MEFARVSKNEGDLVAKVYYAKKKLVWEFLDGPLKNKIEIQWSEISAIRAFTYEGEHGQLEIEEQLRVDIVSEIKKLGRVSLIDLADRVGVDLYYVEKQAQVVVANDPLLMLTNGEIISDWYWNNVCEEINDRLQECSQIALAEIDAQLQVGSELLVNVLEPRIGSLIKGRLEGGQLYTPAYVARVNAMVHGAARGITVPMNLSALWSSLQLLLQEMDGASGVAVEGTFFQSMFNGLVKEGQVLGSVRAGVHWTPNVFSIAQRECVDSFFSQFFGNNQRLDDSMDFDTSIG